MDKQELIFVPSPGMGHMVPTLEFANRLLNQYDHIKVTLLILKMPSTSFLDSIIKAIAYSNSRIQLIQLPQIVYPSDKLMEKAFVSYVAAIIESYKPHVRTVVSEILSSRTGSKQSSRVPALVLDLMCSTMSDIGNEFCVPSYIFFICGASFLSFLKSVPRRHDKVGKEFSYNDPPLSHPAFVNPVPVQVLPSGEFNIDGDYNATVKIATSYGDAKGIVINTFVDLVANTINSLLDGECPPIYPVGPILSLTSQPHPELDPARWKKITDWLDDQPQSSVLFLCFGSAGYFSAPQVEELAIGLEKSGHRFLWCLRARREIQGKNPEEMLPEGFPERIGQRGIVCGWAPQVEVLGHSQRYDQSMTNGVG